MHPLGVGDAVWAQWGTAFLGSNAVAVALVVLASWAPRTARALFALGFIAASVVNTRLTLVDPLAYLDYAEWAAAPYRAFILGPFRAHPALFVLPIAAGQLACGLMLGLGGGRMARLGALGAAVFLVAIGPLGFGSAFPATIVMAAGVVFVRALLPEESPVELFRTWLDRRRTAMAPAS